MISAADEFKHIGFAGRRLRDYRFRGDRQEYELHISANVAHDLLSVLDVEHDRHGDQMSPGLDELRRVLRELYDT